MMTKNKSYMPFTNYNLAAAVSFQLCLTLCYPMDCSA